MKNPPLLFLLFFCGVLLIVAFGCSSPSGAQTKVTTLSDNTATGKTDLVLINDSIEYEIVVSSEFTDYLLEIYNYEERVAMDTVQTDFAATEKSFYCKFNLDNARSGAIDVTIHLSPLSVEEEGYHQEAALPLYYKKCIVKHTMVIPELKGNTEFTAKSGETIEDVPRKHRVRISYLEKR